MAMSEATPAIAERSNSAANKPTFPTRNNGTTAMWMRKFVRDWWYLG